MLRRLAERIVGEYDKGTTNAQPFTIAALDTKSFLIWPRRPIP